MNLTIFRQTPEIYIAKSDVPYWSDGSPINARLAFDASGVLSAVRAQAIDRSAGISYILVSPFSIKRASIVEAAKNLPVGQSVVIPC